MYTDNDMQGQRGQANGLVYGKQQMPPLSSKNKNAIDLKQKWRYVLRHGSGQGSRKHILEIGKDLKKMLVQCLPSSYVISKNITDPAKHFLGCNNVVRDYTNIGEKGKMVMAGERYDDFRCCTDFYVPKGGETTKTHIEMFRKMEQSMNALLLQTMCERTIKNEYKLQRGKDYDFHSFLICSLFSQLIFFRI